MTESDTFFSESTEASRIKAEIVVKYFWAWAKVITPRTPSKKIGYIDLYSGPGRYDDGTLSTPLLILEKAIADENMRDMLVSLFNDEQGESVGALQNAVSALEGVSRLQHSPQFMNETVDLALAEFFGEVNMIPSLVFIDPWGYKGLSQDLIHSVLKDWASEVILFFNYNRINMGINNSSVREHMNALFGSDRVDNLQRVTSKMNPTAREAAILAHLSEALEEKGGKFQVAFRFAQADNSRTSHYLIFISKNVLGHKIMKDVMAASSSSLIQGVPTYEWDPMVKPQTSFLNRPLDDLEDDLAERYQSLTLTMDEIYRDHHPNTPYVESNYKAALRILEDRGRVTCEPPVEKRRRNSFGKNVRVTFPLNKEESC